MAPLPSRVSVVSARTLPPRSHRLRPVTGPLPMPNKRTHKAKRRTRHASSYFIVANGTPYAYRTNCLRYDRGNCPASTWENPHWLGSQPDSCDYCYVSSSDSATLESTAAAGRPVSPLAPVTERPNPARDRRLVAYKPRELNIDRDGFTPKANWTRAELLADVITAARCA